MKRLGQSPKTTLMVDKTTRDRLFTYGHSLPGAALYHYSANDLILTLLEQRDNEPSNAPVTNENRT